MRTQCLRYCGFYRNRPTAPAFAAFEFQPDPESIECRAEELSEAEIESSHQIAMAFVVLTEDASLAAFSSHGSEAAVVETHEAEKWSRLPRREWGLADGLRAVFVEEADDVEVVGGDIEAEGHTHEVDVAEVIVFVLVKGTEHPLVADAKIAVVFFHKRGGVFTVVAFEDEFDGNAPQRPAFGMKFGNRGLFAHF